MNTPLLLIDGDQFIFKATAALEKETRWDDYNHVLYSNAEECWTNLNDMLERVFQRFSSEQHGLCFGASPNFRREIDPSYKSARSPRKPLCYATIRERAEEKYNCLSVPGLEADDVMGILATKPNAQKKIIVSQDKDMKTIPSTIWDGEALVEITEQEADYWHLYQTLVGDSSDGYKGCPGVGPKKAALALEGALKEPRHSCETFSILWEAVVLLYKAAGLTEEDALRQARLARILRFSDWDSENRKPILWTP